MDHSQPEAPEASGPDGPTGASPGGIPPAGWLRLVYGLGGLIVPFVGIKLIDVLLTALHLT